MSADGDHQRTIEAVVAALGVKARDSRTSFDDWNGLFEAAQIVVRESNGFRSAWLYGDDTSEFDEAADSRVKWARYELELGRCHEFSTDEERCALSYGEHTTDDLGIHHAGVEETFLHHGTRGYVTRQTRWVSALPAMTWEDI